MALSLLTTNKNAQNNAQPVPAATTHFKYPLTNYGLGQFVLDTHADTILYATDIKEFFIFQDGVWVKDTDRAILHSKILNCVLDLEKIAQQLENQGLNAVRNGEKKEADKLFAEAMEIRGMCLKKQDITPIKHIAEMISLSPQIAVKYEDFDKNQELFNVSNGTINLVTGAFKEHDPSDMLCTKSPVTYDPSADAPVFKKFLEDVQPDPEMRAYIQRVIGLAALGYTNKQNFIVMYGASGANGKSTFVNSVFKVLGGYARKASQQTFTKRDQSGNLREDIVFLAGARLVSISETAPGMPLDEALVKAVTGGDFITVRSLYKESFSFQPAFLPIVDTNHRPRITGDDGGIWRRVQLVPWDVTVPAEKRDDAIGKKLEAEASGILNWIIEGAKAFAEKGLCPPEKVLISTRDFRDESDYTRAFLLEMFHEVDENTERPWTLDGLFRVWKHYCSDSDIKAVGAKNSFGQKLVERGVKRIKDSQGRNRYVGLKLKDEYKDLDCMR